MYVCMFIYIMYMCVYMSGFTIVNGKLLSHTLYYLCAMCACNVLFTPYVAMYFIHTSVFYCISFNTSVFHYISINTSVFHCISFNTYIVFHELLWFTLRAIFGGLVIDTVHCPCHGAPYEPYLAN